jgi:hypothetical protein
LLTEMTFIILSKLDMLLVIVQAGYTRLSW